jgi:hypothetical protein
MIIEKGRRNPAFFVYKRSRGSHNPGFFKQILDADHPHFDEPHEVHFKHPS